MSSMTMFYQLLTIGGIETIPKCYSHDCMISEHLLLRYHFDVAHSHVKYDSIIYPDDPNPMYFAVHLIRQGDLLWLARLIVDHFVDGEQVVNNSSFSNEHLEWIISEAKKWNRHTIANLVATYVASRKNDATGFKHGIGVICNI